MKSEFPGAVPEIPVRDVDIAAAYYRDNLGFSLDWGGEDGGLAGISKGNCRMFLANPEFRQQHGNVGPIVIWLNLDSKEEVEELYQIWKAGKANLISSPESKPWGLHEFTASDLDGNLFRVFYDFVGPTRFDDARPFIESLADAGIWVLAVGIRGTPSIPRIANGRAMDAIAEHRIDVSEIGDDDAVFPFNYGEGEKQLLPFFTTDRRAMEFASTLGSAVIQLFQPLELRAGFVTSPENDEFDLILDPATPEERRITPEERRLLRARSVSTEENR